MTIWGALSLWVLLLGYAMVIVTAFRDSPKRGLQTMLLPPYWFKYAVNHWKESRIGLLVFLVGTLSFIVFDYGNLRRHAGNAFTYVANRLDPPDPVMAEPSPADAVSQETAQTAIQSSQSQRKKPQFVGEKTDKPGELVEKAFQRKRQEPHFPRFRQIELADAQDYFGKTLRVTSYEGLQRKGILIAFKKRTLIFGKSYPAGAVTFEMPEWEVRLLEVWEIAPEKPSTAIK